MSKADSLTKSQAEAVIRNSNGKIMNVLFIKRTDGQLREMVCRTGVKKHLKGGKAAYNFSDKNLVSVYDMQAEVGKGYRSIPLENIRSITINGTHFRVR
jgi:hypothetical protein